VIVGVVALQGDGYLNGVSVCFTCRLRLGTRIAAEYRTMKQVLIRVPLVDWPIYGYGTMLFLAFFFCTWLAARLAKQQGIATQNMQDVGIWIFVCGILGARITFMIQYHVPFDEFYKIWDGGLVFYGSAIGGVVGYFGAYATILRKHNISTWKMADVIAPCGALGLCLGRVGCLLNGCCYGNVACPDCPSIHFPMRAAPRFDMVARGYQTAAGFTLAEGTTNQVGKVEPDSPAYQAGLRDGDTILQVNGTADERLAALAYHDGLPRDQNELILEVRHNDPAQTLANIGPFKPLTLGLHPTQVYESISMVLLFLVMLAYMPFRRRDGAVMVVFMLGYAVHRFLNEMLRTDTAKVAFDMTLSQNISILVFVGGIVLALILWRRPVQYGTVQPVPAVVVPPGAFQRAEVAKVPSSQIKPT
jgi:phosphatidylglycerol:prolipoprotein diacylglycerol transferase